MKIVETVVILLIMMFTIGLVITGLANSAEKLEMKKATELDTCKTKTSDVDYCYKLIYKIK